MVRTFYIVARCALCLGLAITARCEAHDPVAATFHRLRQAAVDSRDPVVVRWADFELQLGEIAFAGEHGEVHTAAEINELPSIARRALLERIALRRFLVREALSGGDLDSPAAARFLLAHLEQAIEEYYLMRRFRQAAMRSLEGSLPVEAAALEQSMARQRGRTLQQRYQTRLLREFGPVEITEVGGSR